MPEMQWCFFFQIGTYKVKKGMLSPASGNVSSIFSSVSSCVVVYFLLVCVPFGSFLFSLQVQFLKILVLVQKDV